jgi:hypothetical protein
MTAPGFEGWGVLELLGHRVRYGRISEVVQFGEAFCRIDFPTDPPTFEIYAGKSIYGWRPATEQQIRAIHAPRLALPRSVTEHTSAGHRRAFDDEIYDEVDDDDGLHDDQEIATNLDEDGEPIPPIECPACGKPLGDEFVTVDAHGKRELWHRECAEAGAYKVLELKPLASDPAAPEPVEGGS